MVSDLLVFGFWVVLLSVLRSSIAAKECNNDGNHIASHTIRAELALSKNETWKNEIMSHYHLTPTDESAWMYLLPRKLLSKEASPREEFDWAMFYRSMKGFNGITSPMHGANFLKEVPLQDVRLDPDSIYGKAQQTNLEYLLMLDADRLVWNFRQQAGLPTPGDPYGGWEKPGVELRGHFVGHYLSASALMWASTGNDTLHQTMTSVVNALSECQNKTGTGYLSAFPPELFDRFEALQPVWAPYYTIHKIIAGLLDQYSFAGNSRALQMAAWMAEYFGNRVKNVIQNYTIERHWLSLNEETGGMNDVLYRLYSITGDQKHLILAHLFDKPCFLGFLAVQADSLSGFHANTHIPIVVGAQMRYEITGDPLYKGIGTAFMDIVNSSHSYATGGTSVSEFWSEPKRLASTLNTENEESCTTYNMLKVSRHLFRWTKDMAYADYYERALTNGVLSIQRGREPGVMIYMLPLGHGVSKAVSYHGWGTQFDDFWCCYGTGIESFSKLGDSIYFEEMGSTPGLYIIQLISSSFNWKSGGITINQNIAPINSWEPNAKVLLTILPSQSTSQSSTINLRIPFWTSSNGSTASYNGQALTLPPPGNFLSITKAWGSNDSLSLQLPITLRTEAVKDDLPQNARIQAILFGPYLLAGLTTGDWDINAANAASITDWITPVPASARSHLVSISQKSGDNHLFLSNINNALAVAPYPKEGTNDALAATFRLIPQNAQGLEVLHKNKLNAVSVKLEPIDFPGMAVANQGPNNGLRVSAASDASSVFSLVSGLNGRNKSVSLESSDHPGCFVYSDGTNVKLVCRDGGGSVPNFVEGASFEMLAGLRAYHPISFWARGVNRNFLLQPLLSLRDETYTVYFNLTD